jgi:hypothetical protein
MRNKWKKKLQITLYENEQKKLAQNKVEMLKSNESIVVESYSEYKIKKDIYEEKINKLYEIMTIVFQKGYIIPHDQCLYQKKIYEPYISTNIEDGETLNYNQHISKQNNICPNSNSLTIFFMCFNERKFINTCLSLRGDLLFFMNKKYQYDEQCVANAFETCSNVMKLIPNINITTTSNNKFNLQIKNRFWEYNPCNITNYFYNNALKDKTYIKNHGHMFNIKNTTHEEYFSEEHCKTEMFEILNMYDHRLEDDVLNVMTFTNCESCSDINNYSEHNNCVTYDWTEYDWLDGFTTNFCNLCMCYKKQSKILQNIFMRKKKFNLMNESYHSTMEGTGIDFLQLKEKNIKKHNENIEKYNNLSYTKSKENLENKILQEFIKLKKKLCCYHCNKYRDSIVQSKEIYNEDEYDFY